MARLVELALVVPVEVSSRLVEAVPAVVDKVPSAAERVRREVVLARFLGKMVVDQGVRELRSRLTPHDDESATTITAPSAAPGEGGADRRATLDATPHLKTPDVVGDDEAQADAQVDAPDVETLALADYDHLSSAQIIGKLEGLDGGERRQIERYERAGRHRRTVLGKLAQLEAHE